MGRHELDVQSPTDPLIEARVGDRVPGQHALREDRRVPDRPATEGDVLEDALRAEPVLVGDPREEPVAERALDQAEARPLDVAAPDSDEWEEPSESGTLARSSVKGTLWLSLQAWSVNLASLVVFIVLGRLLTPAAFGLVGSASVIVLFLRTLVDAGISKALIRAPKLSRDTIDTAFWLSLGVGAVLTAVYCAVSPLIAAVFGQPRLTAILLGLSPIIVFAAFDRTQSALLDRAMKFRVQATRAFFAAVVSSVLAVVGAVLGFGVWSLVLQSVSFELVSLILLWSLSTWRPRLRFPREQTRGLLRFGVQNQGIQVLGYLSQNIDNFLIGIFLGPVSLGVYVVGYRVLIVLDEVLSMTLRRVALPAFSRLQHDREAMNDGLVRMSGLSAIIILPSALGLLVVAPHLVPAVFGAKWLPSVGVMQALVGAAIVQSAIAPLRNFVIAAGHVASELWWVVGFTSAEIVGFVIAAQYNVYAVAIVLSAVSLVYWPVRVWSMRRLIGLEAARYWQAWTKPLLATTVMAAGVALIEILAPVSDSQIVQLIVAVVIGVVIYGIALFLVDRRMVRELRGLLLPAH